MKELILHENVNTNDTAAALLLMQMLVSGIILAGAASLRFSGENKEENVLWSTELEQTMSR